MKDIDVLNAEHLFWLVLVVSLLGQFIAYVCNVALRLAMIQYQEWKINAARSRVRRCECGVEKDVYAMRAHILDKHKEWTPQAMDRVMKRFGKGE